MKSFLIPNSQHRHFSKSGTKKKEGVAGEIANGVAKNLFGF